MRATSTEMTKVNTGHVYAAVVTVASFLTEMQYEA